MPPTSRGRLRQGLALVDFDGKPRTLADFKGKVVVVFFGYTLPGRLPHHHERVGAGQAGAGCRGRQAAGAVRQRRPERDTPAVLKAYMQPFDPSLALYAPT
jgi:protein SCO1/2